MELETLEVLLEVNTKNIQESINRVLPQINGLMKKIEGVTGQSGNRIENNLDISDGTKKMENTLGQFISNFSKQMDRMEELSKSKTDATSRNLEQGFKQTRTKAGKEIDLMVKDINAKMGQARAAQNKIAHLTAKKSAAINTGDTGNAVRYDEQIARAEQQMTSYRNKAQEMARTMKQEFDAVPQSLSRISAMMDQNEGQIETMRAKIANMQKVYDSQRKMTGNFKAGFSTTDSKESVDTMQKIQVQSAKMNKLIASNDALQRTYATTEDRAKSLRAALDMLGTELDQSTIKTGNAAMGMQTVSRQSQNARSMWSRFGGLFNRVSNNIAHGSRRMSSGIAGFFNLFNRSAGGASRGLSRSGNQFNRYAMSIRKTIWMLGNQLIIFTLLYRGIMALGTGMWSSLKANEEFANSLNQIKVNLLTAFYPIYQAVLPAINALMRALATATGYIASFVATLFGTTYTAAKEGASALYDNVKAMEETGTGAGKAKEKVDKLKSSLMGFDEINRIGLDVGADDSTDAGATEKPGATNFATALGDYQTPEWLLRFAENAKSILSRLFEPVKAAWDQYGQSVMDAFKYALTEIWELAKSIGRAFLEVWTNGTGERILGNILQILASIFNSVGNLANGFREAWETNNLGVSIFQSLLGMIEDASGHLRDMAKATEEWTKNLDFTPLLTSVDTLLKAIRPLTDTIGAGLAWLYEHALLPLAGWTIEGALPAFLDVLSSGLDVLNSVIDAMKPTFHWLWDTFLQPIAEWTGGVIVSVLENLADTLSGIGDWISENQQLFADFVLAFVTFAGALKIISGLKTAYVVLSGVFSALANVGGITGALGLLGKGLGAVVTFLGGPWAVAIGLAIGVGVLLWKNWDTVKEKAGQLKDWIGEKWDNIKSKTSEVWGNVKESVSKESEESRKRASENAEKLRTSISTTWENVKSKTSESWTNFSDTVRDKVESARKWGEEKTTSLRNTVSDRWNSVKSNTADAWSNVSNTVRDKAESARSNATSAFQKMGEKASEYGEKIKTSMSGAFNKVSEWASNFGSNVATGLNNGISAIKSAAANIGNGLLDVIKSAVNGVIGGVNWVLDKVGSSKTLAMWSPAPVKAYASGTNYHPGGPALVNDAGGSTYREAYRLANGQMGLFPAQRNLLVDLPKGAQVMTGHQTAKMMGNVPAYANGIGDWFSKTWNGAKEMAGTVWDYVSNPEKLLDVAISKYVDLTQTLEPGLSIAKGAIGTIAGGAVDFIKGFLGGGGGGEGNVSYTPSAGVEQWRSTVEQALRIAGQFNEANVNRTLFQMQTESGGNPNAINKWDINWINGVPSKGLLQVIDPTFRAYAHPSYNQNIYDPLSNILASVRYAVSRYGSLGNAYRGVGYENGGLVQQEGYYRLAEGNMKEMVIPLEKRGRALELLEVAKSYLGVDDSFPTLQMPEVFREKPQQRFNNPSPPQEFNGGGLTGMSQSMMAILAQIANDHTQSGGPAEIILQVDRTKLGEVVIKEINHVTKRDNKSPLRI